MKLEDVKTVDVTAKEWFDKSAGNSYFSAVVTLNYGMSGAESIPVPFQYGYGSSYQDAALEAIKDHLELGEIDRKNNVLWRWCEENGIILRSNKMENCKKRDAKAWGE